uniref:Cathepsin L n=1 Tax=Cuerna arida TaxID=1464854 RepID=A0A1B6GNK1_9HEMI
MEFSFLAAIVTVALSLQIEASEDDLTQWELFKVANAKKYNTPAEENKREAIFLNKLRYVREHNEKFKQGKVSFEVEINAFSDLDIEEFSAMMNGYKLPKGYKRTGDVFNASDYARLPGNVDWRKKGAVTKVKNQGRCGSCYTFSATGSLEGQHYLKSKKLVSLSEQNLVDCSKKEGNDGCNGGFTDYAFRYIQNNHGIDTEASYPYEALDNKTCRYNPKNKGATVNGFVDIPSGSEKALQQAVAKIGPISVGIDAEHYSFKHYHGGVYKEPACSKTNLNHAVLVVGYGSIKNEGDYWLVKNSWGTNWGMNGYILMARNDNNMCGIATMANYPKVNYPSLLPE